MALDQENDKNDPLQNLPASLKVLFDLPLIGSANTETQLVSSVDTRYKTASSSTTTMTDLHALAERLMFDSTKLVSILDEAPVQDDRLPSPKGSADVLSVTAVLRGAAVFIGAFSIVCGVGSLIAGTTLVHPFLALLLIVTSVGFYIMSRFPALKVNS